jgi:drug/metabolite transporter (DMT)-like permease
MLRSLVTAVSLVFVLCIVDIKRLYIDFKDIWMFLGSGILSIAFFNICYFISIEKNALSLAAILLYTAPSFVVVMSRFIFKEALTRQKIVALILSLAGMLFSLGLIGSSVQVTVVGFLVGTGSGIGYALYSIFSRLALKKYNWLTVTFYTFLFASLSMLPLSRPIQIIKMIGAGSGIRGSILALGLISTLCPFLLYTKGLECMEVGKASVLTFIEPLVATLVGILVFHEQLTISNVIGMMLIISSIVVLNLKQPLKTSHQAVRQQ